MNKMTEKKKTILLRVLIIAALLAVAGACVYMYLHFGKSAIELVKDTERFRAWIDGFGVWGVIVFVAIRVVQTVFKFIPTEPIEIGAGLVWGWFGGFLLCLLGNIIGSIIILLMTRRIGTRILRLFRLEKKLQSMRFLQDREKRNRLSFIFYLIPGTPKDTMTYFVGLTDMNMIEFMIISSIARTSPVFRSFIHRSASWCQMWKQPHSPRVKSSQRPSGESRGKVALLPRVSAQNTISRSPN